jgi:hypothetical protein
MISLAIGTLQSSEADWFWLIGGYQMPGLAGAAYEPGRSSTETTEDGVRLDLRGSRPEVTFVLRQLEFLAWQAEPAPAGPRHSSLYLRVGDDEGYWYSRLSGVRIETRAGHWQAASEAALSLNVTLRRENHFDGEEQPLALANNSGGGVGGTQLYNHDDAAFGHDNWFLVNSGPLGLTQPAPLRLALTNKDATPLGAVWVGGLACPTGTLAPAMSLEGESGGAGETISNADCSAGAYARHIWSGNSWHTLGSWTVTPQELASWNSTRLVALARLAQPLTEPIAFRIAVTSEGQTIWEGPPVLAEAGTGCLNTGLLQLPTGFACGDYLNRAQGICIQALAAGSADHMLTLDFLQLLPQGSFRQYLPVSGLPTEATLMEDSFSGQCWSVLQDQIWQSHAGVGAGLWLPPGGETRFVVFQQNLDGLAPISRRLHVQAWYRRRKCLP